MTYKNICYFYVMKSFLISDIFLFCLVNETQLTILNYISTKFKLLFSYYK